MVNIVILNKYINSIKLNYSAKIWLMKIITFNLQELNHIIVKFVIEYMTAKV